VRRLPYRTQCVYFALAEEAQRLKVGISIDVHSRIGELQTGCPHTTRLLYAAPGNREIEHRIHSLVQDHHLQGEWFAYNPWTQKLVECVKLLGFDSGIADYKEFIAEQSRLSRSATDAGARPVPRRGYLHNHAKILNFPSPTGFRELSN
jgi:hypothetical protein